VIEAASADEIDEAHFLLILNKNENIVPAVAKLEGRRQRPSSCSARPPGTSAGGADEAGKFLRVPGTNPFFPMPHDLQGNRFLELLAQHPLEVYVLNTGRVGGPDGDERSRKVRIKHSSAIVKGIARHDRVGARPGLRLPRRRLGAGDRRARDPAAAPALRGAGPR
jgi:phosphoenolpyruvate carboxykinase (ATP)